MSDPSRIEANVERFSGFAGLYDRVRPSPPPALLDLLCQLARVDRPALVVDVGSGTGISTLIWAGRAEQVIGVEPSSDMRHQAEAHTASLPDAGRVSFREGSSGATGLPDAATDIVTVSQALHWMEPGPTFAEAARILRPGGIFAAYDCDWPPALHWEVEQAYITLMERVETLERQVGPGVQRWKKSEHLARMRTSGTFRYTNEVVLHQVEQGDAERIVGIALSQGGLAGLLKRGMSEETIGVTELRTVARRTLGDRTVPWYWSYRVRLGMK
jgi:ubiquinone/menaquinone biosynthesis C-methylase UbiE